MGGLVDQWEGGLGMVKNKIQRGVGEFTVGQVGVGVSWMFRGVAWWSVKV